MLEATNYETDYSITSWAKPCILGQYLYQYHQFSAANFLKFGGNIL